ncbi:MAG: ABC transporter [Eubacteriales bacterium]
MSAIYRREMRAYFTSAIGYVFVAIFFAVSGGVFVFTTLYAMSADVTQYFTYLLLLLAVLLPLLTMKLFSEERRQRTEQMLLTAPVSIFSMVSAKFLAAYTVFAGCMGLSSLSFLLLYPYGYVKTAMWLGNLLAMLLVGMAFIAIGLFVSALTENQLAAAVGSMGIILLFLLISLVNRIIPVYWLRAVVSSFSIFSRFQNFTQGIFDVAALIYYLSVTAVFLFLTMRVYDKRRYL